MNGQSPCGGHLGVGKHLGTDRGIELVAFALSVPACVRTQQEQDENYLSNSRGFFRVDCVLGKTTGKKPEAEVLSGGRGEYLAMRKSLRNLCLLVIMLVS